MGSGKPLAHTPPGPSKLSVWALKGPKGPVWLKIYCQQCGLHVEALTVAGIDIHLEVNALLVAWKLNKGAEEVGRALKAFMEEIQEHTCTGPTKIYNY